MRRRRHLLALGATALPLLGGCAERRLVAEPGAAPGTGTWVAVWVAAGLAAVVLGVLLTLPVWRERGGGAALASTVLSLQAGAALVVLTVVVAAAVRTWQLLDRPADEGPAAALLSLSRIDGDAELFSLIVVLLVLGGALLVTILALAARFASGDDLLERILACVVLGAEVGLCGFGAACLALGYRGWPYLGPALALPLVVAAFASAWPARADRAA